MSTVLDLATRVLSTIGALDVGEAAVAEDISIAKSRVMSALDRITNGGEGGRGFSDVDAAIDSVAGIWERVICSSASIVIKSPLAPPDMAHFAVVPLAGDVTVSPNARLVSGASGDQTVNTATTWAYRADIADWVVVSNLTEASTIPYAPWVDDCIVAHASEEVAPLFEIQLSREKVNWIAMEKEKLRERLIFGRGLNLPGLVSSTRKAVVRTWN